MPTTRNYSDFDFSFIPHPNTGDLVKKTEEQAIKQSVKNLILTSFYERPFHPEIGSQIGGALFENNTPLVEEMVRITIREVLENYEHRVSLNSLLVDFQDNGYQIDMEFFVVGILEEVTVNLFLKRV